MTSYCDYCGRSEPDECTLTVVGHLILCQYCNETDDAPEPPDDDDPHGITARNKWADEEYGLGDGCG